jgi:DNA polymerase I-like protein with 3'-5' exonuclease and polymerase domains
VATDWKPPAELPDLRRVGTVALDLETHDDGLAAKRGSSWPWGGGHICGISVAWCEGESIRSHYFSIRHPETSNFDREQVFRWLKDLITSDVRFVTQNGLYDWGWLRAESGILMPPSDRLEEIGALATIVDENRLYYSLDALCAWRDLPGKDETLLQAAAAARGIPKKTKVQSLIWQLPAHYVGPYAEQDAVSTLALFENLNPILDQEGTRDAYRLEVDLLPMVLEMRRRGIRIDLTAAERGRDHLLQKRDATFVELSEKLGVRVGMEEINRNKWLTQTFDAQGIEYPRTEKGNPSFRAGNTGWMTQHPHWLPRLIVQADKYNNAAVKFLEKYILEHTVNGRVHAEVHPHRSDDGGTRSLRFSYSHPPLQQMTAHDEELSPLIRGVFLPEEGEVWAKPDVSQQEFRLIVHYAAMHNLPRAMEAVERYRSDPNADFHALVAEMTGLDRQAAKNTNFAKSFGAGPRKFAQMIGKPEREARTIYDQYDRELPFVSRLSAICQHEAKRQGYTELYDGARRHWGYEVVGVPWTKHTGPCSREEAQRRLADPEHLWHGLQYRLRRAEVHKALNALIQGSAARHTKLWMRACWREGIVPLLQMHDSLDCSVTTREQAERVAQLGCDAVKLLVPMRVDLHFGRNWGDAKHAWEELGKTPASHLNYATVVPHETPRPLPDAPAKLNGATVHIEVTPAETPIELAQESEKPQAQIPLADLIGEPLVDGKIHCPFHDDTTPSLHVYDDHFHCFGCGAHGDHIDWLMMIEGMDRDKAVQALENWDGPISQPHARANDDVRTLASAQRLWEQAEPITGTLAARYLAEIRRIDLGVLPAAIDASLRFHPRCPFGPGVRHPCLLALFRDVRTNEFAGIHRIALTPDAGKIDRRTLGRWPTTRAIKLWPAGPSLVIGEGIETVLAAATRIPYRGAPLQPAWAMGGCMAKLPVLPGIKRLILLVDNDTNGAGQAAAYRCDERWNGAGCTVVRLKPKRAGADFNDIIMPE